MRITFVISTLGAGGAERVLSIMANYWAGAGHDLSIVVQSGADAHPFYALDRRIQMISLDQMQISHNIFQGAANNLRRIMRLRRVIAQSQPDAVISMIDSTNVLVLLATLGLPFPVIVSERNDPAARAITPAWAFLRKITYGWAGALVVQSEGYRAYFKSLKQEKVHVIPNPIPPPDAQAHPRPAVYGEDRILLSVGRLHPQKGYDLLIPAFAQIAGQFPGWKLVIVGEGAQRAQLERLINDLGLSERIALPGRTQTPGAYYQYADIFISSSLVEGFPNVICEALSYGLPVIATRCAAGVEDIIQDGKNGVLVAANDVQALALAMRNWMDDLSAARRMGENGSRVSERYAIDQVMAQWEALIAKFLSAR